MTTDTLEPIEDGDAMARRTLANEPWAMAHVIKVWQGQLWATDGQVADDLGISVPVLNVLAQYPRPWSDPEIGRLNAAFNLKYGWLRRLLEYHDATCTKCKDGEWK